MRRLFTAWLGRGRRRSALVPFPASLPSFRSVWWFRSRFAVSPWPRLRPRYCAAGLGFCIRSRRSCCRRRCSWLSHVARPRLASAKNSVAPQIVIQRSSGSTISSPGSPLWNLDVAASAAPPFTVREIAVTTLRIQIDNSACDRLIGWLCSSLRISKIAARLSRYPPRFTVIMSTIPITIAISIAIVTTTIVTRMWISLIVRQWIPADVVAE